MIDEMSFPTMSDRRIVVSRQLGNVTIRGYPATYSVLVTPDGQKALSQLTFVTENKVFTVTMRDAVLRDSEEFDLFVRIAESLH